MGAFPRVVLRTVYSSMGQNRVYGVDVGYGQVAWKLRNDDRVILKERTNIRLSHPQRRLYNADADERPTLGVMDVSFIALGKVLACLLVIVGDAAKRWSYS